MDNIKLSVIIPAYNEEQRIKKTLESVNEYLTRQSYGYEVIVVSNASTDKTTAVVNSYKDRVINLRVIDIPKDKCNGKGCTVKWGIDAAKGDFVVFMDADNSTRISEMTGFWKYFGLGYGAVIGSRRAKGAKIAVHQSWTRELPGRLANILIQLVAVPGVWDTQCGFKAFKREVALKIFSKQRITQWGFDIEVLALARKFGCKIKEAPVEWINDPDSKVSASGFLSTFKELFQIRWWLWTGRYNK